MTSLRELTPDDWADWRALRLAALAEAPHAFCSTLADWQAADPERWRERLRTVAFNVVAYLDQDPVGMVSATSPDDDSMVDLISMWVAPSARGRGVGDTLVLAVVHWAARQGASTVRLEVRDSNERALALYRRHRFVDAGATVGAAEDSPPQQAMVRHLHPSSHGGSWTGGPAR